MLASYRSGTVTPFVSNQFTRGIGFNRNTWNLGRSIARNANSYLNRIREMRRARVAERRAAIQPSRAIPRSIPQSSRGVQIEVPGGSGDSRSLTVIGKPGKLKSKFGPVGKMLSPCCINTSSGVTATCAEAAQQALLLGRHLEASDIGAMFTALSQTAQADNSGKVFIKNVDCENLIVNASTHTIQCIIYDVMARHDGFTAVNTDPVSLFNAAGADAQGGSANDEIRLGYTPFMSPRFTAAYKVLKTTKIVLGSGLYHTHEVRYNVNKAISLERVTINGVGPIGGVTVYSFVVFHGGPVHDTATELTITSGECKVDAIRKEAIYFTQVLQTKAFNSITTDLTTVTGGEQWTMNDPTDTLNAV